METLGSFVTPAVWTTAESSITVVNACLPSLRPLFARVIWRKSYRAGAGSQPNQRTLTATWWNGNNGSSDGAAFKQLRDATSEWGRSKNIAVSVHGGRAVGGEEHDIGDTDSQPGTPLKGIMVKTTVVQEISERLNYHDELL